MENNEIYIDGVDVAECGYFYDEDKECSICGMGTDGEDTFCKNCEDNSNCYYKQLKRLEQENARLKNERTADLVRQIDELKAENEWLKFKLDTVEADYEASEIEIEDLKNKLNLLATANKHLLELDKYRQKELETKAEATKSNIHNLALLSKANKTLQEIKTIAERNIFLNPKLLEINGDIGQIQNIAITQIIDLITKAEEE